MKDRKAPLPAATGYVKHRMVLCTGVHMVLEVDSGRLFKVPKYEKDNV